MYIELVGTSGAGKTTLANKTRELLGREDIKCATRADFFSADRKRMYKIFWSISHFYHMNLTELGFLLTLAKTRNLGFERTAVTIHEHLKLCYQISTINKRDTLTIWDGGFVQKFANLVMDGVKGEKFISNYIQKRLPADTLLVFLDTSIEEAISRRLSREIKLIRFAGKKISKLTKRGEKRDYLEHTKEAQEATLYELEQRGVLTIRLNGDRRPEDNVAALRNIIKKR
ncbi:MAG: hypothetical protein WDZ70_01915 [Candidatus Paceibacterota bacterium]